MTKAACDLVITIIRISLSWRTVKELRRTRALGKSFQNDTDWEILQLWALYSFHKIYVFSGAEWFASIFPMYYYIKLVLLTSVGIPGTNFPNFWFEVVLVPLMHQIHICLNMNWKEIIQQEAVLIPWKLLDLFLLPGLISDEEAKVVKRIRDEQVREAIERSSMLNKNDNLLDSIGEELDGISESIKKIPSLEEESSSPKSIRKQLEPSGKSPQTSRHQEEAAESSFTSPVARSRVAASSLHLRKFSRNHHLPVSASTRSKSKKPTPEDAMVNPKDRRANKNPSAVNTKSVSPRRKTDHLKKNRMEKTSDNGEGSVASTTSRRPPMVAFKHTKSSLLSQTSKSPSRTQTRGAKQKPSSNNGDDNDDLVTIEFDDDMSISSRRSVGSGFRKFITGDDNIRIRDFLFDLELPSIPSPKRVNHGVNDCSSVSTRTSTASKRRPRSRQMSEDRRKALEEWKKERGSRSYKEIRLDAARSKKSTEGAAKSVSNVTMTRKTRPKPESSVGKGASSRRSSRIAAKLETDRSPDNG